MKVRDPFEFPGILNPQPVRPDPTPDLVRLWEKVGVRVLTSSDESPSKPSATMDASPTREELDAKFERTEARVDARLAGFEQRVADQLGAMAADLREVKVELNHLKGLKTQIWAAAGTAIAITVGSIWAAGALGFSAFESGRNTAVVVRDAQQKIEEASVSISNQQAETQRLLQETLKALGQANKN